MPPPRLESCPHCGQQFGSASLPIHVQRCRSAPTGDAEKKPSGTGAPPVMPSCPYCGQQFGTASLAIHMSRCKMRPADAPETPRERQQRGQPTREELKKAFDIFDKDGSGTLTVDELVGIMTNASSGRPMSLEEASAFVRRHDTNGDGVLDVDEFAAAISGPREAKAGPPPEATPGPPPEAKAAPPPEHTPAPPPEKEPASAEATHTTEASPEPPS
eukprot:2958396-Prymnesium_polylepis.1